MSLATRCTACGTVFRVVQDQLRVSGGWVRCGRCSEVFNALESLVDLAAIAPPSPAPPSPHGERVMEELARLARPAEAAPPAAPAPPPAAAAEPATGAEPAAAPPGPAAPMQAPGTVSGAVPAAVPAAEVGAEAAAAFAASGGDTAAAAPPPSMGAEDIRAEPADRSTAPPPSAAAAPPAPGFVRRAERAARWRRPGVRAALALVALAAALGLGWQVQRSHHDWIAARWPALEPWMQRLCAGACSVEPPRRIESLVVESSGLVRAGAAGSYRLNVVLRNRDRLALRVPSVDLTLTDAQGQVVARRVLDPADLGSAARAIPAGGELTLAAGLRLRDAPVVGYTIEIFYP